MVKWQNEEAQHYFCSLIIKEWWLLMTRQHRCQKTETDAIRVTTALMHVLFKVNVTPISYNRQTNIHNHISYAESKVKIEHWPVAMGAFWNVKHFLSYWNLINQSNNEWDVTHFIPRYPFLVITMIQQSKKLTIQLFFCVW